MVATPACPAGSILLYIIVDRACVECCCAPAGLFLPSFPIPGFAPRATHMASHSGLWAMMIVVFYINISLSGFYNPERLPVR
jgi:hypothetical protein